MTNRIYMLILPAVLLSVSAAVSSMADEVKVENAKKCITTRNLERTAVLDDLNILFIMKGDDLYHNILPKQCKGLARNNRFAYETIAGRICEFDTIRVLTGMGGGSGRSCRLGYFHSITNEDLIGIIEELNRPPESKALPSADVEDVNAETDEPEGSKPN